MRKNLFAAKIINKNIISFSINHLFKIYMYLFILSKKQCWQKSTNRASTPRQSRKNEAQEPSSFLCVIFDANCVTTLALSLRSFNLKHPTSCFGVQVVALFFFFSQDGVMKLENGQVQSALSENTVYTAASGKKPKPKHNSNHHLYSYSLSIAVLIP